MAKNPACFTDVFIPIFAYYLKDSRRVLDPMAGSGKITQIRNYGWNGQIQLTDIEQWEELYSEPFKLADATSLPFEDGEFDACCTSPTYGNRMADTYIKGQRINYTKAFGRPLDNNNTGRMQWGDKYRTVSSSIYAEMVRVMRPLGLLIINISDHIRAGEIIKVTDWTRDTFLNLGVILLHTVTISTPRLRIGETYKIRVGYESILIFRKKV